MDQPITSLVNPRIKELVRLRNRRSGDAELEILIDGVREIARAIQAGHPLSEVYFCAELLHDAEGRDLLPSLRKSKARIFETTPAVFDKIRYGDRTGGLLAVAPRPAWKLDDIKPAKATLVAVLEGVEKPGNLGAILRTADAAGVGATMVIDPIIDVYNPNAIRASIGTIFAMPLVELDAPAAIDWLTANKYAIIAASPRGQRIYTDLDLAKPTAIVLGSESKGLSEFWDRPEVTKARIPMAGIADSLNVAATAAILFYEAARQRASRDGI